MVRSRLFIEIIREERLAERVAASGARTIDGLRAVARERGAISNVRGLASLLAFDLDTLALRDAVWRSLLDHGVLALKSGVRSIRFRLSFVIDNAEVDTLVARTASSLPRG